MVEQTKNGGIPVVLSFNFEDKLEYYNKTNNELVATSSWEGGHAILAYGDVEYRNDSQTWRFGGVSYDCRIKTYDVNLLNNPNELTKGYFYFTNDRKKWCIPYYTADRVEDSDSNTRVKYIAGKSSLMNITNDVNLIDAVNIENKDYISTGEKNQNAVLRSKELTDMIIKDYNNNSARIDGLGGVKEFDVWTYYDNTDLNSSSKGINVILPYIDKPYTFETIDRENKKLDLSLDYVDTRIDIEASQGNTVEFKPEGSIEFHGDDSTCDLKIVSNEKLEGLQRDTLEIKSENVSDITVDSTGDGFLVNGDVNNIEIVSTDIKTNEKDKVSISTEEDEILISEKDGELLVSEDKDNDGNFETVISEELPVIKTGVTTNSMNVRKGPSTSYSILGKLSSGTKVEIVEVDKNTGWYKIKYKDGYAYISYKYVKIELPVIKTGVTTNSMNVRKGPSTSYSILGKLSSGTKVEIVEVDKATGWYKIKYGNGYAYISYKYVKLDGEELPVIKTGKTTNSLNVRKGPSTEYRALGKLSSGTKVEIVEVDKATGWYKIKYYEGYGYVSYKYVKIDGEELPVIKTGVTTNSMNVRKGPSTRYSSIGKLASGTKVEIVEVDSKTGWYKIKYKDGYAYISYKYVKIELPVIKTGVTTNSMNVRKGPSTGYSIIGKLSSGTKVEIVKVDSNTGWYKIKYGSGYGYISYKYVRLS